MNFFRLLLFLVACSAFVAISSAFNPFHRRQKISDSSMHLDESHKISSGTKNVITRQKNIDITIPSSLSSKTFSPFHRRQKISDSSMHLNESHKISSGTKNVITWQKNIDITIPSSLSSETSEDSVRSRTDDHSLYWVLISISKNLPWIRNIYIVVDGHKGKPLPLLPYNIPSNINVIVVNRCKYLQYCPTKNGFAVQTMLHKIEGLSEHFILIDDDIMFGRPATPLDFFTEDGKPFAWRQSPTWSDGILGSHHRVYVNPSVFRGETPTTASPVPHFAYPMLKSFATELAQKYKDWYHFVESHKEGRYSSESNSINDRRNSQEEDLQGVWSSNLITSGRGSYKNINSRRGEMWDEVDISSWGFNKAITDKPLFMNVNDRFSTDKEKYEKQIAVYWNAMEKLFGVPMQLNDK
eukprot:UC4_evm1s1209